MRRAPICNPAQFIEVKSFIVSRAIRICVRTSGARARKGGSGKNTYGIYRLFGRLRRNVGGTNQVADRVRGHVNITRFV